MSKMNTSISNKSNMESRGHPRTAAPPPGRTVPPGQGAEKMARSAPRKKGGGRLLMFSVFILSALVGGGVAGLFLAMNEQQATSADTVQLASTAEDAQGAQGDAAKALDTLVSALKQEEAETTAKRQRPDAAKAPDAATPRETAKVAAPEKPDTAAGEKESGTRTVAATAAAGTGMDDDKDIEQLKVLTEQVVATLTGADNKPQTEKGVPQDPAKLRESLARLVDAALAQGKSDEQIRKLMAEALSGVDARNLPASMRDASGKIDIHRLLASILSGRKAVSANLDSETRAYFKELSAEASRTVTVNVRFRTTAGQKSGAKARLKKTNVRKKATVRKKTTKSKAAARSRSRSKKPKGRFFLEGGRRYTIVRKGDTLSGIAIAAYGDQSAYTSIIRANRGRIDVRKLQPGMRILVPDLKSAKRGKPRKRRRQSGVSSQEKILQALREELNKSKVIPANARVRGYIQMGARGVKIINFKVGRLRR